MPQLPTSCLVYCHQFLATSGTSKVLLQASFLPRNHYGLIKAKHFSNDVQIPSNLVEQDETQKAKFSPSRSRDTSSAHVASRLDVAGAGRVFGRGLDSNPVAGAFNASNTPTDSHLTIYDQANSCSLSSVMQTNVPEPFNAHGDADYSSHLSMPGGQWAQNDKYLSADLHDHHYRNSTDNDDLKKGEINQRVRAFKNHLGFTGAFFAAASNKHPGSRQCSAAAFVYNVNTPFQRQKTVTPHQTRSTTPRFAVESYSLSHEADLVAVQLGTGVTNMLPSDLEGIDRLLTKNDVNCEVKKLINLLSNAQYDLSVKLNTRSAPWSKTACGLNFNKRGSPYTLLAASGITDFSQTYSSRDFSSWTYPPIVLGIAQTSSQTLSSDWLASRSPLPVSCPSTYRGQCLPSLRSLTTSALNQSEVPKEEKKSPPVLSSRQKLKQIAKDYGSTVIVFHVTISLASLGLCYLLVSSGIDMAGLIQSLGIDLTTKDSTTLTTVPNPASIAEQPSSPLNTDSKTSPSSDSRSPNLSTTGSVAAGVSTFVVAYAVHKVFAPARIAITLTATPLIVRRLRVIGFLKPPRPT